MKKIIIELLLFILAIFIPAESAFIDPGWGTRGAGKGGAFIATADDASSVMWNPAALSYVFMREGMLSYHKPYAGLDGINISMADFLFVYPVQGIANFGAAVSMYSVSKLYLENIYQLTAAREFYISVAGYKPMRLAFGLNVKYLYHKYIWDDEIKSLSDPITDKDSAGAVTMDLGILFQPRYEIPVGISIKNLIPANVGLAIEDIVPMEMSLGVAYRLGSLGGFEEFTPEIKVGFRDHEYEDKINYAVGVETWLNSHTIGLRMGYNKNEIAFGTSFEKYAGSIGFRIDYTVLISMSIGDNFGSHRVSTSVKF